MRKHNIWFFLLIFIAGCATTERKAKNYYLENKDQLAKLCSDCFPVKTEFRPGKPIQLPADTVFVKGLPVIVRGDCPDGTKVDVPCPPSDTIKMYIPVQIRDTLIQADSAAIYYWQSEHKKVYEEKLGVELKRAEDIADKKFYRKWFFILAGAIAIFIIYKGYRFYAGGFLKG